MTLKKKTAKKVKKSTTNDTPVWALPPSKHGQYTFTWQEIAPKKKPTPPPTLTKVSEEDIANISKLNKTINFKIKEKESSVFLDNLLPEFVFVPEKSEYSFTADKDMKFSSINIKVHNRKYCLGLNSEISMHQGDVVTVPFEPIVYEKLLYIYENP